MPRPQPETITEGPFSWTLPSWKMEGFGRYVSRSPLAVLPGRQGVVVGVGRSRHERRFMSASPRHETRRRGKVAHTCHIPPADTTRTGRLLPPQMRRRGQLSDLLT